MSLYDHIDDTLQPFPGALCIGYVRAMNIVKTNPDLASNKPRPVVLSRQKPDGWWLAWGLTSKSHYKDGRHRAVATGMEQCGLPVGYIWGGHVVQLPPEDICGVVWAAPRELILACADNEHGMRFGRGKMIAYDLHEQHLADHWTWPKP